MVRKVNGWKMVLLAAAAMAGCVPRGVSPEARAVLEEWLARDCETGDTGQLRDELRKYGPELEDALLAAFEKGPPEAVLAHAERTARERFERVQRALRTGRAGKLDPQLIEAIRTMSLDERLKRVRKNTTDGYRAAARAGLEAIGSRKGRQLMEREAGLRTNR